MKKMASLFIAAILFSALARAQDTNSEHAKNTLEIHTRIIESCLCSKHSANWHRSPWVVTSGT